ncbi:hypothetical protein ScPMuIL_018091 [Solemya velum]
MVQGCAITSKVCLLAVGVVFWAAAAGLCYISAWVFSTYKDYSHIATATMTLVPASIILAVGCLMFLLGLVSCVAACKDSKCLLAVLFSLLLIVLTFEVTAGALGYVYREDVKTTIENGLQKAVDVYNGTYLEQMDYVQKELKCCGVYNATDWMSSRSEFEAEHHNMAPKSCCKTDINCTGSLNPIDRHLNTVGCYSHLEDKFLSNLGYIAGIAITFAVIQILAIICTCILFCRSKEVGYETLGGPVSGLRV